MIFLPILSYTSTFVQFVKSFFEKPSEDNADNDAAVTIESVLSEFHVSNYSLKLMMERMDDAMDNGLQTGLEKSSIAMLPSFVWATPDGSERGKFLAMDMGGTNLRCLLYEIAGPGQKPKLRNRNVRVTDSAMNGDAVELFDFIANSLAIFLDEQQVTKANLPLGFTFSYPCEQTSLRSSILLRWTKGVSARGVEGMDVVALLEEAIERQGEIKVRVVAVVNDTVGTLMAAAADHPNVHIGVIVATGTNCAYLEEMSKMSKLHDNVNAMMHKQMIINTEWGAFGDRGEMEHIRTPYDRTIDKRSTHPGIYLFDKLIAGMFMGELVRLVLVKLIKHRVLFKGRASEAISTIGSFPTKYISEILGDDSGHLFGTRLILDELAIDNYEYPDLLILREICIAISKRSAHLTASAIAVIINRMNKSKVSVGVDGSTYWFHPLFNTWVEKKLIQLVDPEIEFTLVRSGDGSGRGAALVAAIADKASQETPNHVI